MPLPPPPGSARDSAEADKTKAAEAPLPHWEPCNPGCDPEFNGQRSRYCGRLCENARKALAAAGMSAEGGEAKSERRPTALRGLAYELDGVLADFSEDPKAAPDAVCIGTIERVRDKLRELAASPKAGESRTEQSSEEEKHG